MTARAGERHSQRAAERWVADIGDKLGRFVAPVETPQMAMICADAGTERRPLIFANDGFLGLTGLAREATLGTDLLALLRNVTGPSGCTAIEVALKAGADANWRLPCRRADGGAFFATVHLSTVHDAENIVRQHILSFVERGREDAAPPTENDELHAMYDRAPGFIATLHGPDHRFTYANAAYERFVGRTGLVGVTVAEALPEIAEQGFITVLDEVLATGTPFVGTETPIRLADADGQVTLRYMSFVYQPMRDADGGITGLFCEGFDVSEQKLARDEVLSLQSEIIELSRLSAVETVATTLSHELNQPLAAIVNYAAGGRRLIAAGDVGSEQHDEVLQAIAESSERAGDIIRHLRQMAMHGKSYREAFDVQTVLLKCLSHIQVSGCENTEIDDASIPGGWVEADPVQIQQVLINLLRNACEASAEADSRSIAISMSLTDDAVVVSVTDCGRGVPADVAQPGAPWTPSTKITGMGVGLSISRTIVDGHGGKLWLESTGPDGSCFAFTLPRIAPNAP